MCLSPITIIYFTILIIFISSWISCFLPGIIFSALRKISCSIFCIVDRLFTISLSVSFFFFSLKMFVFHSWIFFLVWRLFSHHFTFIYLFTYLFFNWSIIFFYRIVLISAKHHFWANLLKSKTREKIDWKKQNLIRRAFGNDGTTTKDPKLISLEIQKENRKRVRLKEHFF